MKSIRSVPVCARISLMKIRIGVGAGGAVSTPEALGELITGLDELGFDSVWLSEVLTGPVPDPAVGLAWAAAFNAKVKLGTTMLLPGRNVLRLPKHLATPHLSRARGHRRGAQAAGRGDRRGAPAAAAAVGGRDGEPRGPLRQLQGR